MAIQVLVAKPDTHCVLRWVVRPFSLDTGLHFDLSCLVCHRRYHHIGFDGTGEVVSFRLGTITDALYKAERDVHKNIDGHVCGEDD